MHPCNVCQILLLLSLLSVCLRAQEPLPGTQVLEWDGDLASRMIEGIDRFLLRKLDDAADHRDVLHASNISADEQARRRHQLAGMLGVRDPRAQKPRIELIADTDTAAELASNSTYKVFRIRWQATDDIHGRGLLLEPGGTCQANIVAIPDAEQLPEWLAGKGYARHLAAAHCRVIIPTIVSRRVQKRRNVELTDREYLYRSAFELGRQLTGYELQGILSILDWFRSQDESVPVGLVGWGEGGRLALYAAALQPSVRVSCVSGYFGPRTGIWQEPLDRNVFGLLNQFGDAEIAALAAPASLIVDTTPGPSANVQTRGGAPYRLNPQEPIAVAKEVIRAREKGAKIHLVTTTEGGSVSEEAIREIVRQLGLPPISFETEPLDLPAAALRQDQIVVELDRFNQRLLAESPYRRKEFFKNLDVSSVQQHRETVEWYREYFRDHVIGRFDEDLLPPAVRTRKVMDRPHWTGYEVVLDVFPDVFAFGILLLPNDLKNGEKRPVVVCQHGLEGRPRNVIQEDQRAYHDYAARLAERGFITFAPQNIYIFRDRFRTLQRKANPIGKTLFSIMVPQHRQIVDWLATLPNVDPQRIAFYGLSYGGKSAMRIPPLVDRYCLAICSADFNDWVWKNASTLSPYSYVWTGEYEIFEWDLGGTFNYSEMATLIAPRPFMVERGHFDGVAPDERVAYEFAKVRHLYQAQLGIGDRCEIEFFVGPHTINGKGTFDFLHRHLSWPKPK